MARLMVWEWLETAKGRHIGLVTRTSNYPKRIALSNPTHMMSMADPIAIDVETLTIDSGCSLEKEFTKLIRMNL